LVGETASSKEWHWVVWKAQSWAVWLVDAWDAVRAGKSD